jgi:pSer/pThr/pTyr-binding forkhead associated (FHA) protein
VIVASTRLEEVLLALKIAFLVLLYVFIWRIVRTAGRGIQVAQQSIVLRPVAAGMPRTAPRTPRLVVLQSPTLDAGSEVEVGRTDVTIGRAGHNDVMLAGDEFASGRHVRVEPRPDGIWVEDVGSTNGTFVNGARLEEPRRLEPGDVVRVGETDLRFEA